MRGFWNRGSMGGLPGVGPGASAAGVAVPLSPRSAALAPGIVQPKPIPEGGIQSVRARRAASQAGPVAGPAASAFTARPTEDYFRNYGNVYGRAHSALRSASEVGTAYEGGIKRVPRLFKPGTAGYASPDNAGHPFSASMGEFTTVRTPHIRARTLPRNTPRAVGTGAVLRPASAARIIPAQVPRARFAR